MNSITFLSFRELNDTDLSDWLAEAQAQPDTSDSAGLRRLTNAMRLEQRAEEIERALREPFMDKETALTLLDELAEIQIKLETE